MSYFDHARCIACGAQFDPEQVVPRGDGFACPKCGAQMGLKDLFGLKAAFDEEAPPDVTLDDLVPGCGPGPSVRGETPRDAGAGLPARRQPEPEQGESALDLLKKIRRER